MTESADKVRAYSVYLWIATAALVVFNLGAAMSHNPRLAYVALALTGLSALAGIGFGIWAALALAHRKGDISTASRP